MTALDTGRFCGRCGIHRVTTASQLCPCCADDEKRATGQHATDEETDRG